VGVRVALGRRRALGGNDHSLIRLFLFLQEQIKDIIIIIGDGDH
jgi:hypothetical protein